MVVHTGQAGCWSLPWIAWWRVFAKRRQFRREPGWWCPPRTGPPVDWPICRRWWDFLEAEAADSKSDRFEVCSPGRAGRCSINLKQFLRKLRVLSATMVTQLAEQGGLVPEAEGEEAAVREVYAVGEKWPVENLPRPQRRSRPRRRPPPRRPRPRPAPGRAQRPHPPLPPLPPFLP